MKLRFLNLLCIFGMSLGLCTPSSKAEAIFASVKATGMAAACISYPLDTLVGAYNPAGMVDAGDRLDLEAGWVHNTGHAHVSGNQGPIADLVNGHFNGMRTKDIYPVSFGLNKVYCLCNMEASFGVVVYNRNYQKTTYSQPFALLGTSNLGLEYLNETVSPCFALKFCERHTIGLSVNYQIERLKVNGIQNFKPISVSPDNLTNRGYDYSTGWGVTIGYLGEIIDGLHIGATYQPKTHMRGLNKYKGFLAGNGHGSLDIPMKIGAGISYRTLPCLVIAFDVEFIQWSKIRALHNPLLDKFAGQEVLQPLGSKLGPGFGFRDQWYYRVGADWQVNDCWSVRTGFRHANTPIRKSQTGVNMLTLDLVENFATIGTTYCINCAHEISAVFAWGFEKTLKGTKNSIPEEFGGGKVNLTEQKYALGLAWGWKY